MNRLFVVFSALLILFFSCNNGNWTDSLIINNSEFDVIFKLSNTRWVRLPSKGKFIFETTAYQYIEYYGPEKRVDYLYDATNNGYIGEFITKQFWVLNITNKLDESVTLSADGWMDELNIPAGETIKNDNRIYTDEPNFSVSTESGFPAIVEYVKKEPAAEEEELTAKIWVTIH